MEKQYRIKKDLVKFSRDNLIQNIRLVHIIDQKQESNILSYKDERFVFVLILRKQNGNIWIGYMLKFKRCLKCER